MTKLPLHPVQLPAIVTVMLVFLGAQHPEPLERLDTAEALASEPEPADDGGAEDDDRLDAAEACALDGAGDV